MPGMRCVICNNLYENTGSNIAYHEFPKNDIRKHQWLQLCGIKNWNPSFRVCSEHFTENDYAKTLKQMKKRLRRRLKLFAVPSLKLSAVFEFASTHEDACLPLTENVISMGEVSTSCASETINLIQIKNERTEEPCLSTTICNVAQTSASQVKGTDFTASIANNITKAAHMFVLNAGEDHDLRKKFEEVLCKNKQLLQKNEYLRKLVLSHENASSISHKKIKILEQKLKYLTEKRISKKKIVKLKMY